MGNLVNYSTSLHQATKREYIKRMVDDKINCMLKAKEYEFDYWDGSRRYGYGGYKYMPDRWKPVAELLIKNYKSISIPCDQKKTRMLRPNIGG